MPTERTATAGPGASTEGGPSAAPYAAASLVAAAAGCAVASWRWDAGAPAWLGSLLAWAVQAGTFWPLCARLRSGERALHVWVAGIAARVAGLGGAALLAWAAGLEVGPAAIAYGATVAALLLGEACWLSRSPAGGSGERPGDGAPAAERSDG